MQEEVDTAATTHPETPAAGKACDYCGRVFVTAGKLCMRCYKRRSRQYGNGRKCICGKPLGEKSLVCLECWNAATLLAREQIAAKCGRTLVQPVAVPERYMPRVSVGYKYGEGE